MIGQLLFGLVREVDKAVSNQVDADISAVMSDLRGLHKSLESGDYSEDEFDELEETLLERLRVLKEMRK